MFRLGEGVQELNAICLGTGYGAQESVGIANPYSSMTAEPHSLSSDLSSAGWEGTEAGRQEGRLMYAEPRLLEGRTEGRRSEPQA